MQTDPESVHTSRCHAICIKPVAQRQPLYKYRNSGERMLWRLHVAKYTWQPRSSPCCWLDFENATRSVKSGSRKDP